MALDEVLSIAKQITEAAVSKEAEDAALIDSTRRADSGSASARHHGKTLDEYLDRAFRIWKGETYWLLAPYKLRDPGVTLQHDGRDTLDGTTYDRLHLSFADIDTSGDEFWLYVNPKTHLVDRWKYRLGRGAEGEFRWKGWEEYNGLMMSTIREAMDGSVAIRMTDIVITNELTDAAFSSPEPAVVR